MSVSTLLEQQQNIIRTLKRLSAERAQADAEAAVQQKRIEAAAATQRKQAEAAAERARDDAHKVANKEISLARNYLSLAKSDLEPFIVVTQTDTPSSNPGQFHGSGDKDELVRHVETAHAAYTTVQGVVKQRIKHPYAGAITYILLAIVLAGGLTLFIARAFTNPGNASAIALIPAIVAPLIAWAIYSFRRDRALEAKYVALKTAVGTAEQCYSACEAANERVYDSAMGAAQQKSQQQIEEARAQYQRDTNTNMRVYQEAIARLREVTHDYTTSADVASSPWDNTCWDNAQWERGHTPSDTLPNVTRIGMLHAHSGTDQFDLPGLLPLLGGRSVLFEADAVSRPVAISAMQSIAMRLLATVPPKRLLFTFIDPDDLGRNSAPFMALREFDTTLVTRDAWTTERDIKEQLEELERRITFVNGLLGDPERTIEQYNQQAGAVIQPYRVLVAFDFPESCLKDLEKIAATGPRCGVYALIMRNTSKPSPHDFSLDALRHSSIRIVARENRLIWEDDDFRDCTIVPDVLPGSDRYDPIVMAVGAAAKADKGTVVYFETIAPKPEERWRCSADSELRVPLGTRGVRYTQELVLNEKDTPHALLIGRTGSGKTTLFHTIITGIALRYRPDDVHLYLMDLKQGVGFKIYTANKARQPRILPHARVVAIESEREYAYSVLQRLDKELADRGARFRAAGVDQLSEYRKTAGIRMPRILLLVDEFQELFIGDDQIAAQSTIILERLARQGRSNGIHIMLGSQTLRGTHTLPAAAIGQIAVRIALQCNAEDARYIFGDDNLEPQLLSRQGEAIYNAEAGRKGANNQFQVAFLTDEQQHAYLDAVDAMMKHEEVEIVPSEPPRIFEGNAPAEIQQNRSLADQIATGATPDSGRRTSVWLGEPIAIHDPVAATFRREGSNLLIVGQDEDETVLGMFATALVSLGAQLPTMQRATPQIAMVDFGAEDGPHGEVLRTVTQGLPQTTTYARRRQMPDIIATYAAEVQRRIDADDERAPAMYLLLYGLHRARDLREEEGGGFNFSSTFSEDPFADGQRAPSLPKQFITILREGPDVGVHTIVWCDTVANLNRTFGGRMPEVFSMRVAFQMSENDSVRLIDGPAANRLGHYRALFYDEDAGRMEKFRPYSVPTEDWLSSALHRLGSSVMAADA